MGKVIATDHFSLIEVKRRLRDTKEYLHRFKRQRLLFLAPEDSFRLPVISLNGYDCNDEYNFVSSASLSEYLIRQCVKDNRELFVDESNFKSFTVVDYVDEYYDSLKRLFSVTCFCLLDKNLNVSRKIVVCLGSLHHAPRVFYRDDKYRFYFDKLASYNDLH